MINNPLAMIAQLYWHAPHLWPLAAGGAAVLILAVTWLYPTQLGQVPWPWRGVLPALRVLAVLALAVSVLRPVAVRLATASERGQIVVLVDRSRSMGVVDNARTPAQLVALADALGKLPAGLRGGDATALASGLEHLRALASDVKGAREDLDYARVSGRDAEVRQARLLQATERYTRAAAALRDGARALPSADEELRRRFDALAGPVNPSDHDAWRAQVPGQIAQAAAAVAQFQEKSDNAIYQSNPEVRRVCDAISTLSRFELAGQSLLRPGGLLDRLRNEAAVVGFGVASDVSALKLEQDGVLVKSLETAPDGDGSDLTAGIARTVAGRPVRAVVLFSDGRQVGGDPTIVSGLTPDGVPVFAVEAAAAVAPRDLSFSAVTLPSSVFVGQSMTVRAELRHSGFDGAEVEIHCAIAGQPEQIRKVTLREGSRPRVEFTAKLTAPGAQRVDIWFAKLNGEASAENNSARRWVKVVPERMRVLLVAGHPTWDFQYARNALARLPEVQLTDAVLDPLTPRLHLSAREILSQDVIVLFDVPVAALDERRWDAVERVAQVMGGSVVLVAGDAHLPGEYYKLIPTSTLLPFLAPFRPAWRAWPGDDPAFHFVPMQGEESVEALQLPAEQEGVARRWEQLPGMFRFLQLPEARDDKWKPQARPLLVEEESRLPVLTVMRLGAGRAFFLGFNETWRWRNKVGGRDQDRFWWQLIQYASEDPYFEHNGPLALDAEKVSAEPGEPIRVRARMTEPPAGATPRYALQVLLEGKPFTRLPLEPNGPPESGRFGTTVALPGGEYQLRWTASGSDRKAYTVQIPLHVGQSGEAELSDLSGDPAMLHKLADASGGEFFTLEQVNRLPDRLASTVDTRSRYAELALWDSPYLFLLVVGCLGAEWALRKRVGLA